MSEGFRFATEIERERLDWGVRAWHSAGAAALVVIEVDLMPGFGHAFHFHPRQEESVYVVEGEIEQWLETERRVLHAGDSAFIRPGLVHASYNISARPARVLAILGPAVGPEGYELVEVYDQAPWNSLRPMPAATLG
jgi:quercetin dioxygenase-like cupin family protein